MRDLTRMDSKMEFIKPAFCWKNKYKRVLTIIPYCVTIIKSTYVKHTQT
jgi:hypothetical protein